MKFSWDHVPNTSLLPDRYLMSYSMHFLRKTSVCLSSLRTHMMLPTEMQGLQLWCGFQQEWYLGKHIPLLCYLENSREIKCLDVLEWRGMTRAEHLFIRSPKGQNNCVKKQSFHFISFLPTWRFGRRFEAHQGRHFIHHQPVMVRRNVTDALQRMELLLRQPAGTRG